MLKERAALQVCWPMLMSIGPMMHTRRQSPLNDPHAPLFSSRPLTARCPGRPCCPCAGCRRAGAAAAAATLRSSGHPGIPRRQASTSGSATTSFASGGQGRVEACLRVLLRSGVRGELCVDFLPCVFWWVFPLPWRASPCQNVIHRGFDLLSGRNSDFALERIIGT